MATQEELYAALRNADKAGDVEGARKLAAYIQSRTAAPEAPQPEATGMDRVSSVMTGVNRGAGTRMAGLPVDTVVNVLDLLKAGAGTAYQATTGNTAPDFLLPADRTKIAGTGDWIEQKLRSAGGGGLIDPSGPQDSTSRILHGVGMGAGGALAGGRMSGIPMSPLAQARNITTGALGGGLGSAATENGMSPSASVLFSMAPQAAGAAIAGGAKMAARPGTIRETLTGSDAPRQRMEQRIQDFRNAGIENPSVGLASGRPTLQGVENLLANTPGGIGAFQRSKSALLDGMQAKTGQVRDQASTSYGADLAGRAIQNDLATLLKARIEAGYDRANDRMVSQIPAGERFPITNSLNALSNATAVNPLAPATTGSFVQPRIAALRQNMLADTQTNTPTMYGSQTSNLGMPVSATRAIRTSIGKEAASRAISGTPEQAEFKQVYGGLSEDIRLAARQTDAAQGPQPNGRGPVERSFDRGNALYSAGMDRIGKVQPFANKDAPEQAYNALTQSGKENVSTLRAVKKSIGNDARASTAATWIDRLGRASPGNQNELSDVFSPDRLLTNWNTMNPKARTEVLSGFKDSSKVAASMDDIAKAAAMLKDSSKVWANPSGTGANTVARGAIGATAFGAFFSPMVAGGVAAGIGGVNLSSRLMTNQKFVTWLAESTRLPSSQVPAQLTRLATMANASGDAQFKKDAAEYAAGVKK